MQSLICFLKIAALNIEKLSGVLFCTVLSTAQNTSSMLHTTRATLFASKKMWPTGLCKNNTRKGAHSSEFFLRPPYTGLKKPTLCRPAYINRNDLNFYVLVCNCSQSLSFRKSRTKVLILKKKKGEELSSELFFRYH